MRDRGAFERSSERRGRRGRVLGAVGERLVAVARWWQYGRRRRGCGRGPATTAAGGQQHRRRCKNCNETARTKQGFASRSRGKWHRKSFDRRPLQRKQAQLGGRRLYPSIID